MARLPGTPLGSRRFSQGLLLGKGHTTMRQPPSRLTRRLWALKPRPHGVTDVPRGLVPHYHPAPFFLPPPPGPVSHAKNWAVTALTGRPSTKRRRMPCVSARNHPSHATAVDSGSWRSGAFWTKRHGVAAVQAWRGRGEVAPPPLVLTVQDPVRMPQCAGH